MRTFQVLLLSLLLSGVASAEPPDLAKHPDEQSVSIIQLIANPKVFDGKRVELGGYLSLSDEYENSLFLDREAQRSGMTANAIAFDLSDSPAALKARARKLNQTYVIVAGRFEAGTTAFSGGKLHQIYYLAAAPGQSD